MSTPLYDVQAVKEAIGGALGIKVTHVLSSSEREKIVSENFSSQPMLRKSPDDNFNSAPDRAVSSADVRQVGPAVQQGSLFFRKPGQGLFPADNKLTAITFDLILSETHEMKVSVCQHPVQAGSPISDHIQPMLQTGRFQVLVTNYSLKDAAGGARGNTFDLSQNRALQAYNAFKYILKNRIPCGLVTVLETFKRDEVVITSVSTPRSAESGDALIFDVDYQEVRRVRLKRVSGTLRAAPKDMSTAKNRQAAQKFNVGQTNFQDSAISEEGTTAE